MKHLIIFILLGIGFHSFSQSNTAQDYYDAAKLAYENDDYKTALSNVQKAINLDGSKLDYFMLKGEILIVMDDPGKAFETYCEVVKLFPKKPDGYGERAKILTNAGEYQLAFEDYDFAFERIENDSTKYYLLTNRAALKSSVRDFQGAYEDLKQSYLWDSTSIATVINLGNVCDELSKKDEALKYMLRAIQIDSTCYPAYGNLGFYYQNLGQHSEAIKYFNKVLEFRLNDAVTLNNRSYSRLQLGDTKGAMEDVNMSIKSYPANSYAYRNRALIYIRMKKESKACEDFDEALERSFTLNYGDEVEELKKRHCK